MERLQGEQNVPGDVDLEVQAVVEPVVTRFARDFCNAFVFVNLFSNPRESLATSVLPSETSVADEHRYGASTSITGCR